MNPRKKRVCNFMPKPDSKRRETKSSVELWLLGKKIQTHGWYFYFPICFHLFSFDCVFCHSTCSFEGTAPTSHLNLQFPPAWGWREELEFWKKGEQKGLEKRNGNVSAAGKSKSGGFEFGSLSKRFPGTQLKCLGCFLSGSLHFVVRNKGKPNG